MSKRLRSSTLEDDENSSLSGSGSMFIGTFHKLAIATHKWRKKLPWGKDGKLEEGGDTQKHGTPS